MSARLLTTLELLQSPSGIDWATVAENAGVASAAQAIEQSLIIDAASGWIADYCNQPLGIHATSQVEIAPIARAGRMGSKAWVDNTAALYFRTDTLPVLSVTSLQFGQWTSGAVTWQSITAPSTQILGPFPQNNLVADNSVDWTWARQNAYLARCTYVSGFCNAVLSGAGISAGAIVNMAVDDSTGASATAGAIGNLLTLHDGANTEVVTVTAVPDGTHITVASVANAHAGGVGVTCVPQTLKTACWMVCKYLAQLRGTEAWQMGSASAGVRPTGGSTGQPLPALTTAVPAAAQLIRQYIRRM